MNSYYLAIDIGASSGRHILGRLENSKLETEEIYRFPNGFFEQNGHFCWDIPTLFTHILEGLRRCKQLGKIPSYIGIDTWGVDFVLLDKENNLIGQTVAYRDHRTNKIPEEVDQILPPKELYRRTGIQRQPFNTLYQLVALQKEAPDQLQQADKLLFIPDYLHFLLSGKTSCEYTEASTSGLLSAEKKDWDRELIEILGLPQHIFAPLTMPGTILAPLSRKISEEVGFQAEIVLPATHDTGSAVLAMPTTEKNSVFLSSGTWSLFGCEREHPDTQSQSMHCNFTNEGGYNQTIRYLKNIMGLWMLQSIRRESALSFDEMMKLATQNLSTPIRVDVNDPAFLAPASMTEALRQKIGNMDLSTGELIAIVYLSLADAYKKAADELEGITKKPVSSLHILGGGGKDELLNQLTANALGKPIFVGPTEATSVGNLVAQLLGTGAFSDVAEARTCVRQSFPIASYLPSPILP